MPKVFLVDDDDVLRISIAETLQDAGCETVEAGDGWSVLDLLKQDANYDMVLCDVHMPEMDGLSLLKQIKQDYPDLVVVMLTGEGSIEIAVESMRQGALNYLLKPINRRQLLAALDEAIEYRMNNARRQSMVDQIINGLQGLGIVNLDAAEEKPDFIDKRFCIIGDLVIDQHKLTAMYQGEVLELTPTEFEILCSLMQGKGRVVTYEEIVFNIQGIHVDREEARRMTSSHLSNLRTKMQAVGCQHYLKNQRGRGYFIEADGSI